MAVRRVTPQHRDRGATRDRILTTDYCDGQFTLRMTCRRYRYPTNVLSTTSTRVNQNNHSVVLADKNKDAVPIR